MARRYSIAEARAQLPAIIDLAAAGREVELTRRGQPVAVIVSTREMQRLRDRKTGFPVAYKRFLEQFPPKGAGIDKAFARSLRDRSAGREVAL
ncbi:MAG: type II toxin-antitoxin system Phd/YefM family antitoxin [Bryobacterales bacterium]|nr:type II toxin-antitoxin system Phd/YefM family antitoxin [Bryobacterales bacterium]